MFNSSALSVIVTGGSDPSFVGEDNNGSHVCEKEKDSLVQVFAPHLSRVMLHGTAKHVVGEGGHLSEESFSIVAQAEREDFQEFSPTDTQHFSQAEPLTKFRLLSRNTTVMSDAEDERCDAVTNQHLQRNQHWRTRAGHDLEPTGEPPIIRGLWVQEIDWLKSAGSEMMSSVEIIPPPPQFTDSPPCCHGEQLRYGCGWRTDVTTSEDRGDSDSEPESVCTRESDCDSSCSQEGGAPVPPAASMSNLTSDLLQVSGFISSSSDVRWDYERACDASDGCTGDSRCALGALGHSDSTHTPLNTTTAPASVSAGDGMDDEMRGKVTWASKVFVSRFFRDFKRNDWKTNKHTNEGFIFHDKLQPSCSQYREGEEYCILHHIQNGSYGDVLCVQDRTTGFTCAAKRIPLSHFRGEEVMTWSTLNSARVVELFGAVREGLNVVLFMDLKPACLAQLLKQMKCLPEDLALHFLHQALGALEHLHHKKVLHLDVKVDNVLLSADCRHAFLCDFGLSETLDDDGWSVKAFRGAAFPGTQTHMAPEVARGDNLSAKADVWSSCCMLLHMLNGCHPWIRYYSQPLCLHLVNEPPPLWEVPSNCNNFTAKVFRAGLQKNPDRRASAKELRRRTTKALRAVGGLNPHSIEVACQRLYHEKREISPSAAASAPTMHWVSPWRTMAVDEDASDCKDGDSDQISDVESDCLTRHSQPRSLRDEYTTDEDDWDSESEVDIYMAEEEDAHPTWLKSERDYEGDWEEEGDDEEEEEEEEGWDFFVSTEYLRTLRGLFPLLQKGLQTNETSWGSEPELEYLRDGVVINTTIQTPSPEPRDDPPSCFSCSDTSQIDASDGHSSDDLSSGVFSSCNSGADGHLEWLASENQPSSCCVDGVDIWIENVQGECLRIREHQQVKVGHVAIGISDQISGKPFTLETLDRKLVSFDQEITESCLWLRCVPAPDRCPRWRWRVRDGKLELRE